MNAFWFYANGVTMSKTEKNMRMRIAVGGVILLAAGAAWFYMVSFGPR